MYLAKEDFQAKPFFFNEEYFIVLSGFHTAGEGMSPLHPPNKFQNKRISTFNKISATSLHKQLQDTQFKSFSKEHSNVQVTNQHLAMMIFDLHEKRNPAEGTFRQVWVYLH